MANEPALPTADEAFGAAPPPTADEAFPPNEEAARQYRRVNTGTEHSSPVQDFLFSNAGPVGTVFHSAGRVLDAFGRGVNDAGPAESFSKETGDYIKKWSGFNEWNETSKNIARAANNVLLRPAAYDLSLLTHGFGAMLSGPQAAVAQLGEEAGGPTAIERATGVRFGNVNVGREIAAIPEAFMGAPHPTGMPHGVSPTAVLGQHLEMAPLKALDEARDLGVIGPDGEAGYLGTAPPREAPAALRFGQGLPEEFATGAAAGQGAAPPAPDIHATVRAAEPKLFEEYDALTHRRDILRRFIDEREDTDRAGSDMARVATNLKEAEARLRELAPTVAEAYRAAEGPQPYRPRLVAQGLDAADTTKRQWAASSPIKTIDDLFTHAQENQDALAKVGEQLASELGIEFRNPGVKERPRTQEKIDQGKAPGRINDVVRGGFVVDTPAQADAAVARLAQHFEAADEGWAVTPAGYFDRKVMVRFPNGQVGEIQLWHPDMLRAKEEKGHKLYVESRSLPHDDPRRAALDAQMTEIYSGLLDAAPEWKALLGSGGSEGNLASNAALESTRPPMAISEESARDQSLAPSRTTQASPGAQAIGSPSNEPNLRSATSTSTPDIGTASVSRNIAAQETRKLIAAGRPPAEAQAAAQVIQAYWETRAARFKGAKGTAAEMYAREAPDVVGGPGVRGPSAPVPPETIARAEQVLRKAESVEPAQAALGPGGVPERLSKDGAPRTEIGLQQQEFLRAKGMSWEYLTAHDTGDIKGIESEWSAAHPGSPPLINMEVLKPSQIKSDPARFQFRTGPQHGSGATVERLKTMKPGFASSSPMVVWRDDAGETFVVDGHHRLHRAKEMEAAGDKLQIPVIVLNERDGVTPRIAHDFGKRRNALREQYKETRIPPADRAAPLPGLPNAVQMFAPADLAVDAKRFQFKDGGDEAGVTDRLKGVTQWDPVKAGMVLVWQDKAGKNFIVDGHQRHSLATRIANDDPVQNPQLLARVVRESDGVTDTAARVMAAAKNIAEGTGTAVDAAKVLRDRPDLIKELPPRSELVRQARGLVNLTDDAFRMVVNDVVPPQYAAIVGRLAPQDAELQSALLGLLAKTEPANAVQAEAIVRQGIEAGTAKKAAAAQGSLFGDDDVATSLYTERARVLDKALKEITRDKKVFSVLSRDQHTIEAAGNKLAADINSKRAAADAQALQVLQTLANRKGPVSDALGDAAKRARADGKSGAAVSGFVGEIRRLVETGDLARLADGIERGPAHVGAEDASRVVERAPERGSVAQEAKANEEILAELFQIKAYHGSPNDFDAFDVTKTNAGHWFTENPDLARQYKFGGKLYEVNINAPAESLIDRSKPIDQQSESVRQAIAGIESDLGIPRRKNGDGGSFYADLAQKLAGDGPYREGLVKANNLLRDRGVPGITEGGGVHVVFDDKLIDITHKDGTPVPAKERADAVKEFFQRSRGAAAGQGDLFETAIAKVEANPRDQAARQELRGLIDATRGGVTSPLKGANIAPMVLTEKVYHGTDAEFESFDPQKIGTGAWKRFDETLGPRNAARAGPAFYFTNSEGHAKYFGDKIREAQLNLQNPARVDAEKIIRDWHKQTGADEAFQKWLSGYDTVYDALSADSFFNSEIKAAKQAGQDGLIVDFGNLTVEGRPGSPKAGKVYVVFDPGQILPFQEPHSAAAGIGPASEATRAGPQNVLPGFERSAVQAAAAREAAGMRGAKPQEAPGDLFAEHPTVGRELFEEAGGLPGTELYQGSAKGKIRLRGEGRSTITLFRDADASTFIHETGHDWLHRLMRDAEDAQAPDDLKADAATVLNWLGVDKAADIKTRHHEKFARGFETYMMEGRAPSQALASVFAKFKAWLTRIYQAVQRLNSPINDDIRAVFDRFLTTEPQRTVEAPERESASFADIHEADAAHPEPDNPHALAETIQAERDKVAATHVPDENDSRLENVAPETRGRAAGSAQPRRDGDETGTVGEQARNDQEPGAVGAGGGETAGEGAGTGAAAGPSVKTEVPSSPSEPFEKTSPLIDKAGNIRLDTLNQPEDVNRVLRDMADRNNQFMPERRGVISDKTALNLADALGMDAAKLNMRRIGQAFSEEELIAAAKLLIQSATETRDAMAKAAEGNDADVLAFAEARERHLMIQGQFSGATAEAGRALHAFQVIAKMTGMKEARETADFLRDATDLTLFQLKRMAKLGAALPTPQQVSQFVHNSAKPSFGDMILEYWINGLISGPATHTTYAIGNELLALNKAGPETAVAAAIGSIRQAFGSGGPRVYWGEVPAQLFGMMTGVRRGIVAAWESLKSGKTEALPGEIANMTPRQAAMSPLVNPKATIPNFTIGGVPVPLGTFARLPSRMVAVIHSFFRAQNYERELAALAYRDATDKGLSGQAFAAQVASVMTNPSADLMEAARTSATDLTLMGRGGELTTALSRLTSAKFLGFQWLKFIDPFVHISSNVIEQAILQRTPVGILDSEIRANLSGANGPVARDMAIARMVVGSSIGVAVGSLAAQGLVNGSGPSNPHEAAIATIVNGPPHSIRIGDMWYDIHRLGPLGMQFSIAADLYHLAHVIEQEDGTKIAAELSHAFTQNILDESFMRGPADLMKALSDPDRYGAGWVRNFVSSFVPFSVGQAQIARAIDPYSRAARTTLDAMRAKVSWLSETLLPRRDVFGEPIPNKDALGLAGLSAIYEAKVNNDPVPKAMLDAGYFPAMPLRKIRNVELTDQQYDDYARIAGRTAKMRLDAIVRNPGFAQLPPGPRHEMMQQAVTQSRREAEAMILMRNPEIIKEAADAKVAKLKGEKVH